MQVLADAEREIEHSKRTSTDDRRCVCVISADKELIAGCTGAGGYGSERRTSNATRIQRTAHAARTVPLYLRPA
jgi:hypothetical protein